MWFVPKMAFEVSEKLDAEMLEELRTAVPGSVVRRPPDAPIRIMPLVGRCRRHAPRMTGHPVVYENDWCGDHKLDENKV